jgi:hypothetical protein
MIIAPGLSLAYIGTDSNMAQGDEHDFRSSRFRLGDKKEGAGAAVAVISLDLWILNKVRGALAVL